MPTTTIPYDPSLVLGMIVDPKKISDLQEIAQAQLPVNDARDYFNALLRQKLSLDMTMRELISLGADTKDLQSLDKQIKKLMADVVKAAGTLASNVMKSEAKIVQLKGSQGQKQIGVQLQTPLDLSASQLQKLPLSADSMDMDVQYFRYEDNEQETHSTANAISTFVGATVSEFLGPTYGAKVGAAANSKSDQASQKHGILGTLVIVANCTSKNVQMYSPLVLDPDAAVDTYNDYNKGGKGAFDVTAPQAMLTYAMTPPSGKDDDGSIPVIVGESYGSSFVGFVHFQQTERTESFQSAQSKALQARTKVEANLFLESISGSFGMDAQTSDSVKELLSNSNLQSHASVITMGLIPSIKSSQVTTVVKELQSTPQERMNELATMQGGSDGAIQSLAGGGEKAKTGQSMEEMKTDYIKASVAAVGKLDDAKNKVIDMNSMMTALDDYVAKASEGNIGVPINYYLKYVSKKDIALAWIQKYFPDLLTEAELDPGKKAGTR